MDKIALEGVTTKLISNIYQAPWTGNWESPLEEVRQLTSSNNAFLICYNKRLKSLTPNCYACNICPIDQLNHLHRQLRSQALITSTNPNWQEGSCGDICGRLIPEKSGHISSHFLTSVVCKTNDIEAFIALNKWQYHDSFQHQDVSLFRTFIFHMARALSIINSLTTKKLLEEVLNITHQSSASTYLLCDYRGNILLESEDARALACEQAVISLDKGIFTSKYPYIRNKIKIMLRNICNDDKARKESFYIDSPDNNHLHIQATGIATGDFHMNLGRTIAYIKLKRPPNIDWQIVKETFALSPKELIIYKALCNNQKLQDLTIIHNVSYNTVRTQLRSLLKKTEVNSQAELILKSTLFIK